jgi:hypothetical protein
LRMVDRVLPFSGCIMLLIVGCTITEHHNALTVANESAGRAIGLAR